MNAVLFAVAAVFGFMLAEQRVSSHHERLLRAAGAIAPPGDVFRVMSILYPAAFLVMGIEGAWRASTGAVGSPLNGPSWAAAGVVLFVASKALKIWAMRSLGTRWSFRVYVQPGAPLVTTGPYQYVAHPNYVAVVGELVGTAMMVGAFISGPVMTAAFGMVLAKRIRFEDHVLAAGRPSP